MDFIQWNIKTEQYPKNNSHIPVVSLLLKHFVQKGCKSPKKWYTCSGVHTVCPFCTKSFLSSILQDFELEYNNIWSKIFSSSPCSDEVSHYYIHTELFNQLQEFSLVYLLVKKQKPLSVANRDVTMHSLGYTVRSKNVAFQTWNNSIALIIKI